MGRKNAQFNVEDVVVSITCPYCSNKQPSINYPDSHGWDRADFNKIARKRDVKCQVCGEFFSLPVKLQQLMAGV